MTKDEKNKIGDKAIRTLEGKQELPPSGSILTGAEAMAYLESKNFSPVYRYIKELKEVDNWSDVLQLLGTGKWIAIIAIERNNQLLVSLGRIMDDD